MYALYLRKNQIKDFENETGDPFSEKGPLINQYKLLYIYCGYSAVSAILTAFIIIAHSRRFFSS